MSDNPIVLLDFSIALHYLNKRQRLSHTANHSLCSVYKLVTNYLLRNVLEANEIVIHFYRGSIRMMGVKKQRTLFYL